MLKVTPTSFLDLLIVILIIPYAYLLAQALSHRRRWLYNLDMPGDDRKAELRAQLRSARSKMAEPELNRLSQMICRSLIQVVEWNDTKSLHIYIPLPHLREVDSWPIIKFVWQKYPPVAVAVAPAGRTGPNRIINPATTWRGLAPQSAVPVPAGQQFDLIVVPVLGFDRRLNRLGWGSGWYDRFLAAQPKALKIGLGFSSGLVPGGLPAEPHDIRLDKIITEQGIITALKQ